MEKERGNENEFLLSKGIEKSWKFSLFKSSDSRQQTIIRNFIASKDEDMQILGTYSEMGKVRRVV